MLYPNDHIVTVLIDRNPKIKKSQPRFAIYYTGITVGEYKRKAGVYGSRDLKWDVERNFIRIDAPKVCPHCGGPLPADKT